MSVRVPGRLTLDEDDGWRPSAAGHGGAPGASYDEHDYADEDWTPSLASAKSSPPQRRGVQHSPRGSFNGGAVPPPRMSHSPRGSINSGPPPPRMSHSPRGSINASAPPPRVSHSPRGSMSTAMPSVPSGRMSHSPPPRSASRVASSPPSSFPASSFSTAPSGSPGAVVPRVQRPAAESSRTSLSITPAPRLQTPLSHLGLDIDEPLTANSPSITDKLRHLKLKSRAGRAPSTSGGIGIGPISVPDARNTRAASAFVRRAPSEDELDHHLHGYERPASNLAHYASAPYQSAMGSQTPSVGPRSNHFGERLEQAAKESRDSFNGESISTNSSYESLGGGALNSLRQRAPRRTPVNEAAPRGAGVQPPSSPGSNNSSNYSYPSSSLAAPEGGSARNGAMSVSPHPVERDASIPRRQRFTSEPGPPALHLQIHSPAQQQQQTAFGAARPQPHPQSASSSAASASSYAQTYASLMDEVDGQHDQDHGASPQGHYESGSGLHFPRVASPSFSAQAGSRSPLSPSSYDDRPIGANSRQTSNGGPPAYNREYSDEFGSPSNGEEFGTGGSDRSSGGGSKWDLTPGQAAAMGMDFSLPPSASSGTSSASAKRGTSSKPLLRSKPSTLSLVPSSATPTPLASPPLMSPSRSRNPRVSSTPTPSSSSSSGASSVSSSLTGGGDESSYVLSCDLLPFPTAGLTAEVAKIMHSLQSADWSVRFDSLTSLRRLLVHHSPLLTQHAKALVRDLRTEVNSLRSSLAKNAIMALSDAFSGGMAKPFEPELEQIGPPLLKRAGEPSGFLRDEAHRALLLMIANCSDRATLPLLLNASTTGTKIVKTMACVYIDRAVECYGARGTGGAQLQANKEWSRLVKAIGIFSSDAAVESRTHSRWSLIRLARFMGLDELDRTMKKMLPAAHYHVVNKVLAKGMDQLNQELASAQHSHPALAQIVQMAQAQAHLLQTPQSAKRIQHTSFSLPAGSAYELDFHSGGQDDPLSATAGGLDSIARKRRSVKPVSGLNATAEHSGLSSAASAWNSVRGTASTAAAHERERANMFDLEAPEYNQPLSATASVPVAARASAKRRPTVSGGNGGSAADLEKLSLCMGELASSDWRTRMGALDKLKAFLASSPAASASQAIKIFEVLGQRINDHHGKVNVAALQSLASILPLAKPYLSSVLGAFVPSLAASLASTNPQIRQLAQSGLDQLVSVVSSPSVSFTRELQLGLLAPCANAALFETIKVRPLMIDMLTRVIGSCADAAEAQGLPPALATFKAAIPVAYAGVDDRVAPELRAPLLKCAQALHEAIGQSCWDEKVLMQYHITNAQVQKLKQNLHV